MADLVNKMGEGGATISALHSLGSGLQGLGGVGKTTLALKLAEKLTPLYPDAQFYLDLKGASKEPLSVADALAHVIRAYHPIAKLPDSEVELRGIYFSVLHGQRALLLMDNARDAEQVEPLIPPANSVLLVTSRQHFTLPGLYTKNLDTLSPAHARKLLLTIAPRIDNQAGEIAMLCGYLPLALRLVASTLAERIDLSVADYLRRLRDTQHRLKHLDKVEASLSLSYELLSPELQKLWRVLAIFPDTFDVSAAAAIWEMDLDIAQESLSDLLKYSLLEWNEATGRYRLHDLMRLLADARLSAIERKESQSRHAQYYLDLLRKVDSLYQSGGTFLKSGLQIFDSELNNIQAGQFWSAELAERDNTAASLFSLYPEAGARLLYLRQRPRDRISWLESALAASRRLEDRLTEGAHLGNLGLALADSGECRRAIEFHQQRLIIARELGDKYSEGQALGNLGAAYYLLGEVDRAIDFYEQDLSITQEIGDRRGEGVVTCNLGLAYAARKQYGLAVEYCERALGIAREIGNRRSEAETIGNLGITYNLMGDYSRAIECFTQELLIAQEIGDRRCESLALIDLGDVCAALNRVDRSVEFYNQALTIAREIGDRRTEGNTLFNTTMALDKAGKRSEAIIYAEEALTIFQQIDDPSAAKVHKKLAEWRDEAE